MKSEPRTERLDIRMAQAELRDITRGAAAVELPVRSWARLVLLREARQIRRVRSRKPGPSADG